MAKDEMTEAMEQSAMPLNDMARGKVVGEPMTAEKFAAEVIGAMQRANSRPMDDAAVARAMEAARYGEELRARIVPTSGEMDYRVQVMAPGAGLLDVVVNAATGDGAAEEALRRYPGAKIGTIRPASGPTL